MKLFIKKNMFPILLFLVLTIAIFYFCVEYKTNYNQSIISYEKSIKHLEEHPEIPLKIKEPMMVDTYTLFSHFIIDTPMVIIQFLMPFLLMIVGSYNFYNKMKSGYIKNELMRESYKKVIWKNIFSSWANFWFIPIFLILLFLGSYIISGHFDIHRTIEHYEFSLINRSYIDNMALYQFVYVFNLSLLGIYFINISLIFIKKNNNFFVSIVLSYLTFIGIGIFFEVIIGRGLPNFFPILKELNFANSLSIFNFWVYDNVINLTFMTIYAFVLTITSTLVLIFVYRNKESVIIEVEK